jgi:hypothetical protein
MMGSAGTLPNRSDGWVDRVSIGLTSCRPAHRRPQTALRVRLTGQVSGRPKTEAVRAG